MGKWKNKDKCFKLAYMSRYEVMKKSFVQNIKLLKQGCCISIVAQWWGTRRCCNIQILWTHLCFDQLIQGSDIDIAELIIPIWSSSVKANNIILGRKHSKKFTGTKLLKEFEFQVVTFWNGVIMGSSSHIGEKIFLLQLKV